MIDHETGHFLQTWFDQYVDGFTVGPEDFMFELNKKEFADWRSQFVTSNSDKMGLRYSPMAFTEQGVAMLSSVLRSDRAIQVNIQIMRTFPGFSLRILQAGDKMTSAITDFDLDKLQALGRQAYFSRRKGLFPLQSFLSS